MANREEIKTAVNEAGVAADVDVSRRQFLVGSMAAAGAATLLGGANS